MMADEEQVPTGHDPARGAHIDPVCGLSVAPATAAGSHLFAGRMYYFCSTQCKASFAADPEKYLARTLASIPPATGGPTTQGPARKPRPSAALAAIKVKGTPTPIVAP